MQMLSKELEFTRKPDGGLADQIEVLEAMAEGDAYNTELLMLLIELRSLREQRVEQRELVAPLTIKISEVVAAVSLEQNRKWNGRVGYMAGWNACRDAMLLTDAKPIALGAEDVNSKVDITCYSCRRFITFQQHAEADGFCPYCGVEIELTPSTLAVPNVKTIEDNLIEQVGLMCDQATNIEEKNVYGHAYRVLKYGILPYLRKQGK